MKLINMHFGKLALSAFLLSGVLAVSSASTLASTRDNKPRKQNTASKTKTMTASTTKPHKKSAAKKKRRHARTSKAASPKKS